MIASTSNPITADEFSLRPSSPNGCREELVRGEIVMTPPPGFEHGSIQTRIAAMLFNHVWPHLGRVTVKTGVITERDPDTVRGPDVSYWSKERLPLDQNPRGYPDVAPDFCVEVLSPDDRLSRIEKKVREYFERGVRLVWVVIPKTRIVNVYRTPGEFVSVDDAGTLDGGDVVPGFRCSVADLF